MWKAEMLNTTALENQQQQQKYPKQNCSMIEGTISFSFPWETWLKFAVQNMSRDRW